MGVFVQVAPASVVTKIPFVKTSQVLASMIVWVRPSKYISEVPLIIRQIAPPSVVFAKQVPPPAAAPVQELCALTRRCLWSLGSIAMNSTKLPASLSNSLPAGNRFVQSTPPFVDFNTPPGPP